MQTPLKLAWRHCSQIGHGGLAIPKTGRPRLVEFKVQPFRHHSYNVSNEDKTMKTLFLCSNDHVGFEQIRSLTDFAWVTLSGTTYLSGALDLPVSTAHAELPYPLASVIYLLPRFEEQRVAFEQLSAFPLFVHVFISRTYDGRVTDNDELYHVAWANLYDARSAADQDCRPSSQFARG